MSRLTSALCGMALLTTGSAAALAAEPFQLTDHQLDAITAGAEAGAIIGVFVSGGGASNGPFFDGRLDSGPLALGPVGAAGPGGSAAAEISGEVSVVDSGLFKTALGFFAAQTTTTGNGVADVGATGVTGGGTEVFNKTNTFSLGNETFFVTMAAVLN